MPVAARRRPVDPPEPPRDTALLGWRSVVFGGGSFDVAPERQNPRGWELFELGQKTFWDVPGAIDWDAPIEEDPDYADAIGAMLAFLCPGEKQAVTGATLISLQVRSEEAKFYFAEQALEEAKHYDALRRIIPRITGRPLAPPRPSVRLLYSFGVIDRDDVAFMMGNINVIGEHIANQVFNKIKPVAKSPPLKELLELIGKDESRHIAAGRRFYPEVYDAYARNRHRIMAKNLAVALLLTVAGGDLVNPMRRLGIDLQVVAEKMYDHYEDVLGGLPAFPEQPVIDAMLLGVRHGTRGAMRVLEHVTDADGTVRYEKLIAACEHAVRSPRALRRLFA